MKVVLTAQVPKLGHKNQVIEVSAGYARNFLFPRSLAVPAREGVLKQLAWEQEKETARQTKLASEALKLAQQLKNVTLNFSRSANQKGQLFGSITAKEVLVALKERVGWKFKSEQLVAFSPIKEVGDFPMNLQLLPEVEAHFLVKIVAEKN